ncbi:probable F-box protein At4g22030 [Mangifera indica]|uniref:probable F-box protein At4g22030 n=1 Tax=Mangifera indica TaxID=29780 RepID=UPI001CFB33ED|nr:probable F-box protein At4g22030 [Mangifera indica]
MASLQVSNLLLSCSSSSSSHKINAAISVPKLPRIRFSPLRKPRRDLVEELKVRDYGYTNSNPVERILPGTTIQEENSFDDSTVNSTVVIAQLHAILEAVADRVKMHYNIGQQRDNWNTLLLNSINMITLTATTMAGVAATGGAGVSLLALKLSSTLLFSAATGMMVIVNKIQPSQLAEEQRNATRLFKQLQGEIQTLLSLRVPGEEDVKDAIEKVLALDQAYPLPLLGKMIEKFPKTFEPTVWWPLNQSQRNNKVYKRDMKMERNGWSEDLEGEMREIIQVLKRKDTDDYMRLGNLVLKINKILAISGPLLTSIAAVGSAFVGSPHGSWAAVLAVAAGALATTVNTLEHGAQVGMVLEMYRNCAGFFTLLEESIESTLNESDVEKREKGGMFVQNVALQLGRSTSQLRDLAEKSIYSRSNGEEIDEFASKLF